MKVFLAGATGAAGRLLVPALLAAGHGVAGTTRSAHKAPAIAASGATPVVVDALDRPALFDALRAQQPEAVIHLLTDLSRRDFAANSRLRVAGTRNLVDAARAVGVHRFVAESLAWMYASGLGPAREDEPLDLAAPEPRRNAVAAVQSLETTVAELPRWVVLRFGIFYGPGTWYARDALTTEQVRRGEIAASPAVTSFVHVADAANAALQALAWSNGHVNIVDDEPARADAWVPLYARLVGAPPPPVRGSAEPWERGALNAKARSLGWQPVYPTWRTGFLEALG